MFKRWAALGLVLALCALKPDLAQGQVGQPTRNPAGGIAYNYPNPFNPETWIVFNIGDEKCSEPSTQHVVTIRIVNKIGQVVVTPKLQTTKGGLLSGQAGRTVERLKLKCGEYEAYWNGKDPHTGKEVASGLYVAMIEIDGKRVGSLPMQVIK